MKIEYFIIKKYIPVTTIKSIACYQKISLFFRHLLCLIYTDIEIGRSDPLTNPPFKMQEFIQIAVTIWNKQSPSLNKVRPFEFEVTKKLLWGVYTRRKNEIRKDGLDKVENEDEIDDQSDDESDCSLTEKRIASNKRSLKSSAAKKGKKTAGDLFSDSNDLSSEEVLVASKQKSFKSPVSKKPSSKSTTDKDNTVSNSGQKGKTNTGHLLSDEEGGSSEEESQIVSKKRHSSKSPANKKDNRTFNSDQKKKKASGHLFPFENDSNEEGGSSEEESQIVSSGQQKKKTTGCRSSDVEDGSLVQPSRNTRKRKCESSYVQSSPAKNTRSKLTRK